MRCSLLGFIVGLVGFVGFVGFVGPRFSLCVRLYYGFYCGFWLTRRRTGGACCFVFFGFYVFYVFLFDLL